MSVRSGSHLPGATPSDPSEDQGSGLSLRSAEKQPANPGSSQTSTTDPLQALGHDIFVSVLQDLPAADLVAVERVCKEWAACARAHEVFLWRRACHKANVEPGLLRLCDAWTEGNAWREQFGGSLDLHQLLLVEDVACDEDYDHREGQGRSRGLGRPQRIVKKHVGWRYLCHHHKRLQEAWRNADSRLHWITPPGNTVWRMKSVLEDDVILCTSRTPDFGLVAVDRKSSKPLFSITGIHEWAHLEAGRGFAVFTRHDLLPGPNGAQEVDGFFEVWRNEAARSRPNALPIMGRSPYEETRRSHTAEHGQPQWNPSDPDAPLPRGHLQYYRTLTPPITCWASRLHVDDADGPNPRAVVCVAGSSALFLWHLEEEKPMEKITRDWGDIGRPNYIELDDFYVYICLDRQMHVYARETGKHIVAFPPLHARPRDAAALACSLSLEDDFKAIPDEERRRAWASASSQTNRPQPPRRRKRRIESIEDSDVEVEIGLEIEISDSDSESDMEMDTTRGRPTLTLDSHIRTDGRYSPVGRANVTVSARGEPGFDNAIRRAVREYSTRANSDRIEDLEWEFTACHYTTKDLICTTKVGAMFIIPDYLEVLAESLNIESWAQRSAFIADHTVIVGIGIELRLLTTYRDHVAVVGLHNILLFETDEFPRIPVSPHAVAPEPSERRMLRAHALLGNHPQGIRLASCVQMDFKTLYLTYWATGEVDPFADLGRAWNPPNAALDGLGMCLKAWSFAPP